MYGSQIRNIADITMAINGFKNIIKKQKLPKDDHTYLQQLITNLKTIRKNYKKDWLKYTKISKKQYDDRYNLAPERDTEGNLKPSKHKFSYTPLSSFQKGAKVLYYIGPYKGVNKKWRQIWTGPWTLTSDLGDRKATISDDNGDNRQVSFDRLKLFHQQDSQKYESWSNYKELLKIVQLNKDYLSDDDE